MSTQVRWGHSTRRIILKFAGGGLGRAQRGLGLASRASMASMVRASAARIRASAARIRAHTKNGTEEIPLILQGISVLGPTTPHIKEKKSHASSKKKKWL